MNDEKIPEKPKRTLGRALPKFLQHCGPVMIFGAGRSPSAIVNNQSANSEESAVDRRGDAGAEPPAGDEGQK